MTYQRNILWGSSSRSLEDGLDQGAPDGVEEAQVAAGEQDEAQHDGGGLADVAAVGPLHPAQLVDAMAEEGQEAPAGAGRRVLGPAAAEGHRGVALRLVRGALEVVVLLVAQAELVLLVAQGKLVVI